MFVYYFINLEETLEEAERRVMASLNAGDGIAEAAYRDGERIRARLGSGRVGTVLAKTVRLTVGRPHRSPGQLTIPITWEATGAPVLFPKMEADLIVAAIGPTLTYLSFRGIYRPPLGRVGRALDRTLLHRVAEASVKSFVDRIAEAPWAPEETNGSSRGEGSADGPTANPRR